MKTIRLRIYILTLDIDWIIWKINIILFAKFRIIIAVRIKLKIKLFYNCILLFNIIKYNNHIWKSYDKDNDYEFTGILQ